MAKHKLAYAGSAVALMLGSGVFAPLGAFAEGECFSYNDTMYSKFSEARNAIEATEGKTGTIKLVCDKTVTSKYSVNGGSNVTFDLNGHTYTISGDKDGFGVKEGAIFSIDDSGSGGTIINLDGRSIAIAGSGSTLNVKNGRLQGAEMALVNDGGTVSITGGTIVGGSDLAFYNRSGVATIKDAYLSGSTGDYVMPVMHVESGSVTTDNTTITASRPNTNLIQVVDGASLTMNGGLYDATGDGMIGVGVFGEGASFTMNGGEVRAKRFAVAGNGNESDWGTSIKLNGGLIKSESLGVYHPQVGTLSMENEMTIDAKNTGIEIRAGELSINGGEIVVNPETEYSVVANGNGATTQGAAIAVAQHTTKQPISVKISDGAFSGAVALSEANPQGNGDEDIAKVSVEVSGGRFYATNGDPVVASEDLSGFIMGGIYNKAVDEEYIADGYVAVEDAESYEVVKAASELKINQGYDVEAVYSNESMALGIEYIPEDAAVDFEVSTDKPELFVEGTPRIVQDGESYGVMFNTAQTGSGEATLTVTDKNSGKSASIKVNVIEAIMYDRAETEDGTIADVFFGKPVEGENLAVEITNEELTTEEKAKISPYLKAVYDISVVNQNTNEIVPVSDSDIEIDLQLKNSDYKGMNYFKVAYINDEGKIAEIFDADVSRNEENDWLVLTFNTTHLSSYGILASETEFPQILTPDTGALGLGAGNMNHDYRGLVATVVSMTVMMIVMEVVLYRKNHAKGTK